MVQIGNMCLIEMSYLVLISLLKIRPKFIELLAKTSKQKKGRTVIF